MKRGMISLSLAAIQRLTTWSTGPDAQFGKLPEELMSRLSFSTQEPTQSFEISEETAQSMLDLLPPSHIVEAANDPVLQEISGAFREFVGKSRTD